VTVLAMRAASAAILLGALAPLTLGAAEARADASELRVARQFGLGYI
jgi:hypothetical protein